MKKQIIPLLRNYLDNKELSFMIGAGFSLNASDRFLSWRGLVAKMVPEAFPVEWNKITKQHTYSLYNILGLRYVMFNKQEELIDELIAEYGYLNIAQRYVDKKGMHQYIDKLIEEFIPVVAKLDEKKTDYEVHKQLFSLKPSTVYTFNYDDLLECAAKEAGLSYSVVTDRFNLSTRTRQGQIIKLHGSLTDSRANFDSTLNQKYIITQNDYDDYVKDHEPFTRLMQITLLKDKILALGFSGDDPNFQSWINWVSKTLNLSNDSESNTVANDLKKYKVFLVDVSNSQIDDAKSSFYAQHNIMVVKLKELYGDKSPKELVKLFLHDLEDKKSSSLLAPIYRKLQLMFFDRKLSISAEDVNKIEEYYMSNALSFMKDSVSYEGFNEDTIMRCAKLGPSPEWARTMIHLLNVFPYTLHKILNTSQINYIQGVFENDEFPRIKRTWDNISNDGYIGQVYQLLFSLRYQEAKELIDNLNDESSELDVFEKLRAEAIDSFLSDTSYISLEDEISSLSEKDRILFESVYSFYCVQSTERLRVDYDSKGERAIFFYNILEDLSVKMKTPLVTKVNSYNHSSNIVIGMDDEDRLKNKQDLIARRILHTLMTFGVTPYKNNTSFVPTDVWYMVFKVLYKEDPYKLIYYTLSYNDEGLVKRCAQDLLFNITNFEFKEIVLKLIEAYSQTSTMGVVHVNILMMLSVFIDKGLELLPSEVHEFMISLSAEMFDANHVLTNRAYKKHKAIIIETVLDNTEYTEELFLQLKDMDFSRDTRSHFLCSLLENQITTFDDAHWCYDYIESTLYDSDKTSYQCLLQLISLVEANNTLRTLVILVLEEKYNKPRRNDDKSEGLFLYSLVQFSTIALQSPVLASYVQEHILSDRVWLLDTWEVDYPVANLSVDVLSLDLCNELLNKFQTFKNRVIHIDMSIEIGYMINIQSVNIRYQDMLVLSTKIISKCQSLVEISSNRKALLIAKKAQRFVDDFYQVVASLNLGMTLENLLESKDNLDVDVGLDYLRMIFVYRIDQLFKEEYVFLILRKLMNKSHPKTTKLFVTLIRYCWALNKDRWRFDQTSSFKLMFKAFYDELKSDLIASNQSESDWCYPHLSKKQVEYDIATLEQSIAILFQ